MFLLFTVYSLQFTNPGLLRPGDYANDGLGRRRSAGQGLRVQHHGLHDLRLGAWRSWRTQYSAPQPLSEAELFHEFFEHKFFRSYGSTAARLRTRHTAPLLCGSPATGVDDSISRSFPYISQHRSCARIRQAFCFYNQFQASPSSYSPCSIMWRLIAFWRSRRASSLASTFLGTFPRFGSKYIMPVASRCG
jgi:hypothetical protein